MAFGTEFMRMQSFVSTLDRIESQSGWIKLHGRHSVQKSNALHRFEDVAATRSSNTVDSPVPHRSNPSGKLKIAMGKLQSSGSVANEVFF